MSKNFKYNRTLQVYEIIDSKGSVICTKKTAQEAQSYIRPLKRKALGFGVWGVPDFFNMHIGREKHGKQS